jgi:hypothetical protein
MVIYLYLLFIILMILYMMSMISLRWNLDYIRQLEKQCL